MPPPPLFSLPCTGALTSVVVRVGFFDKQSKVKLTREQLSGLCSSKFESKGVLKVQNIFNKQLISTRQTNCKNTQALELKKKIREDVDKSVLQDAIQKLQPFSSLLPSQSEVKQQVPSSEEEDQDSESEKEDDGAGKKNTKNLKAPDTTERLYSNLCAYTYRILKIFQMDAINVNRAVYQAVSIVLQFARNDQTPTGKLIGKMLQESGWSWSKDSPNAHVGSFPTPSKFQVRSKAIVLIYGHSINLNTHANSISFQLTYAS
jgi:hypothetical protein